MRNLGALLLVVAMPLSAQLVETVEVRVVNLDVVVTDREGKPVRGLTKDDLEVLEDRKAQTITNFTEYRADAASATTTAAPAVAPPEARPRQFLIFVDNDSLQQVMRKQLLERLQRFVDSTMQAHDRASVFRWSRGLKIVAPLTSDRSAIKAAIETVINEPSPLATKSEFARVRQECTRSLELAKAGRMQMGQAYAECTSFVRGETSATIAKSRQLASAIDVALATLAGIEGKKVLLLVGAQLPAKPGLVTQQWANSIFAPYLSGFNAPTAGSPQEDREQRALLDTIAKNANARGVTMYTFAAGTATDTMSAAGAHASDDGGAHDFLQRANTETALETIATATGGRAVSRETDFDVALSTIARDLDSYYSIGYKPAADVRGNRPVTVRAKNRAYMVRTRQSYAWRTADEQMADRVIANIYARPPASEWKILIGAAAPEKGKGGNFVVPIELQIDPTLTLLPQGDVLAGGFTVYMVVGNQDGALSPMSRHPQPVRVPAAEEAAFRKEPLIFTASLTVRPGENLLSIGVVDQVAGTSAFARGAIVAK